MKACDYKISSSSFAHMNRLEDVWTREIWNTAIWTSTWCFREQSLLITQITCTDNSSEDLLWITLTNEKLGKLTHTY